MKIVSWNLEGRLSPLAYGDRGTPDAIVAAVRAFDADVLVHPEAFGTNPPVALEIEDALTDLGYESRSVAYDDHLSRGERAAVQNPHLRVMSRLAIVSSKVIRPGDVRNMLAVTIRDPESGRDVRVIGVHLEDRSEELRVQQAGPLIEYINSSDIPTVVMGDFNAMPPTGLKSQLVHSGLFKTAAGLVPHDHMRYTLERLNEMASGTTIAALTDKTRLINTDPRLTPTTTPKMRRMEWMPSIRFAKIDWILASPDFTYKNFAVSRDLGSDHRALSLEISLKSPSPKSMSKSTPKD